MKLSFSLVSTLLLTLAGGSATGQEPLPDTFSRPISFQFHDSLQERGLAVNSKPVSFLYMEPLEDAGTGISLQVASSPQASFSYGSPPPVALPTPVALSPGTSAAPGPVLQTLTPLLLWRAAAGAEGYGLELTSLTTNDVVLELPQLGPATSHEVPQGLLVPGFHYAWTVRARSSAGFGPPSRPFHFRVAENLSAPGGPRPLSPGATTPPGATLRTQTPLFLWQPLAHTSGHAIYLTDLRTGQLVYGNENLDAGGRFQLPSAVLQAGSSYRWMVRARNSLGWGPASASMHFVIPSEATLPSAPVTTAPGSATTPGTSLVSLTPTFQWRSVPGATGFGLYIADAATNQLVYDKFDLGTDTTHVLPAGVLQWGRAYRWNMRARGANGWGAFSSRRFFQTAADHQTPVISQLTPSTLVGSDANQFIMIQGSGFRSGIRVLLTGAGRVDWLVPASQAVLEDATRIRLTLKTGLSAAPWTVKVRNSDSKTSPPSSFQVVAPQPGSNLDRPNVSPPAGTYTQPVRLTLSHPDTIHYTLNGAPPTRLSPAYTGTPLLLGAASPVTVQAIAVNATQRPSQVLSSRYTFNLPSLALPGSRTGVQGAADSDFYLRLSVPAGLADFTVTAQGGSGNCDLYLSRGVLPRVTDYHFSSRGAGNAESLTLPSPVAGTWFLLVHGPSSFSGVTLSATTSKAQGTTARPEFSHSAGTHGAPFALRITSADANAVIYYSTSWLPPLEGTQISQSTSIPIGPPAVTITAVAWAPGKNPSSSVRATFTIQDGAKHLEWKDSTIGGGIAIKSATLEGLAQTKDKEFVDVPFYFEIPPDPTPGINTSTLTYPVAVTLTTQSYNGTTEIFLQQGRSATASSLKVKTLPEISRGVFDLDSHVLGTVTGRKGVFLSTGVRYYGFLRIWGDSQSDESNGSTLQSGTVVKVDLNLLNSTLSTNGSSIPVVPNQSNTWLIIHGRDSRASNPEFVDMASALSLPGAAGQVSQVLRLDWSSMAWPDSSTSLDEAAFTPGVGRRTFEVLSKWGLAGSRSSLVGHSWGSYVAFETAKHGTVQRLVALDPATTGGGGYADLQLHFARHAQCSWGFVATGGAFGSLTYTATAAEAFTLDTGLAHPVNFLSIARHKAPVHLFTHLLRSNYDPTYDRKTPVIGSKFSLERLDSQRASSFWLRNRFGAGFEAEFTGKRDDDGLDVTRPIKLEYKVNPTGEHREIDNE